jgi:hypothetical protein
MSAACDRPAPTIPAIVEGKTSVRAVGSLHNAASVDPLSLRVPGRFFHAARESETYLPAFAFGASVAATGSRQLSVLVIGSSAALRSVKWWIARTASSRVWSASIANRVCGGGSLGQTLPPAKVLACKKGVVARPYGRREDARLVADTQRYGCEALGRRLDLAAR